MTPIYFRESGLAFGWFSNENGEPPHVHVFRGKDRSTSVKFWLNEDGAELAHNKARLNERELKVAYAYIMANRYRLMARWVSHFTC